MHRGDGSLLGQRTTIGYNHSSLLSLLLALPDLGSASLSTTREISTARDLLTAGAGSPAPLLQLVLPALEVFCGDPFLLVWPDIGVLLALFGGNDSLGLSDLVSSLLDGWSKE